MYSRGWIKIESPEEEKTSFISCSCQNAKAGVKWIMRGTRSTVYISQHASTGGHCVHRVRLKTGMLQLFSENLVI